MIVVITEPYSNVEFKSRCYPRLRGTFVTFVERTFKWRLTKGEEGIVN